ncbi:putative Tyrosinase copper-binding domain-containing protein [Seiridium unicorne]|uniref:Tyrosinase copper-binding domain-containing protein n=1 Tax=Seiridium unicorne TaxID=138068 RepID=A0ABR2V9G0_9PEZI
MKLYTTLSLLSLIERGISTAVRDYPTCAPQNTALRREWGSLTKFERRSYIDAVLCMQSRPSIIPEGEVPGAKTRFDDFTAVHANNTMSVHLSGVFLSWHRNFVWLWEQALREECGYDGYQPYWNWALWCEDLAGSPLFDGSETSLSGDGEYVDYGGYIVGGVELPHGTGGGCVTSGPFQNMTVNLGPYDFTLVFNGGLLPNWTDYTPHCLQRDLNNYIATIYGNQTVVDYLLSQPEITSFQGTMSNISSTTTDIGVHPGGHFSIGLALIDFFASPSDPAFFLHHAMIDRMWTIWQGTDPEPRTNALNGTTVIFDPPGAEEVTLDTVQRWGVLGEEKRTEELMDVEAGEFCYGYE